MWEIKFKIKKEDTVTTHQIVAKKESSARKYAKEILLHNKEYTLISIKPC